MSNNTKPMYSTVSSLSKWAKSSKLFQRVTTDVPKPAIHKLLNNLNLSYRIETPDSGSGIESLSIVSIICR